MAEMGWSDDKEQRPKDGQYQLLAVDFVTTESISEESKQ
jgi:hypothetical protein